MTLSSTEEAQEPQPDQSPILGRNFRRALDFAGTAFWLYAVIKLFVFDFDLYLVNTYAPNLLWILQLRFIVLVGIAGLAFLFLKKGTALAAILYISAFPLIVIFWKIPVLIFRQKSWTLAFALASSLIVFFANIKQLTIKTAIFFISATTILVSSNLYATATAAALIFIIVAASFVNSIVSVFQRSKIPGIYALILNAWRETIAKREPIEERIRIFGPTQLSTDDLKIWSSTLETRVLFNRACLFIARRFRAYQRSRLNVASGVFTSIALLSMTVVSFSFINMAAFNIDPTSFLTHSPPTFFDFFYYSFKTFVFGSSKEIEAISQFSETIGMIENFFALFMGIIFVSLVISVRSQRYSEDLDQAIRIVEKQGQIMELQIANEYKLKTIDDALRELDRASAGMIKFLYWLSNN